MLSRLGSRGAADATTTSPLKDWIASFVTVTEP
jgi:hypothetical protein